VALTLASVKTKFQPDFRTGQKPMKCPFCSHADDRVLDTRVQKDGSIRRRRECLECKARFSTLETIMLALPFIIKRTVAASLSIKRKSLKVCKLLVKNVPSVWDKSNLLWNESLLGL